MKRLKRCLSLLILTTLVLSVFAGCAGGTQNSGATGSRSTASGETSDGTSSGTPASPSSGTSRPTPGEWRDTGALSKPVTVYGCPEELSSMTDIQLSRFAAAEGMVLLKNENDALPLPAGARVALFGAGQIDFVKGGSGSGDVNALYTVNLLEGMRNKAAEGKIVLDETLAAKYEKNHSLKLTDAILKDAASASDCAIAVISRTSGENVDLTAAQFELSAAELEMLKSIAGAGFGRVIVVLNVGAVMSTSFLEKVPGIDALLICWQPGMEGGNATADVLCGDVNPSGKLVDTIAKSYTDYPSAPYFLKGTEYASYFEDIFVGYRWFETFDKEYSKVAFPFGYGLSYTTFELSEPYVREDGENIEAQVLVTNTGSRAGKQTVQVYFSAPAGKLGAPGKVLAGFAKTRLLQPGEFEKLTVSFPISDMAMYDDTGVITRYAYILEAGDYQIFIGDSIRNAAERGACFTHTEKEDRVVLQLDGRIAPTTLEKRLTASGSFETLDASGYTVPLSAGKTVLSAFDYLRQTGESHFSASADGSAGGLELSPGKIVYFNVEAPAAGEYSVFVGYGMNGAGSGTVRIAFEGQSSSVALAGTNGAFNRAESAPVVLNLKKGANLVKIVVPTGGGTFVFMDLTFDDGSGSGVTDLTEKYVKQSLNIASGKKISFLDVYEDPTLMEEFLASLTPEQMVYLLVGHAPNVGHGDGSVCGLTDLDVPYYELSDGPAGLDLAVKQVAWPIETALACSWDTGLLYAVGVKFGEECYKAGVDVVLGPGVNIHRDPLGGRNFEYYSEDPLITGKMASAYTQGVQAKGNAGVMLKHFYANSREAGRVDGNSSISERAARMVYLRAFEICVRESAPVSIMTTYNLANGIYNAENKALLEGVAREEWGFEGFFCTDWGSHSENPREIAAGNDVKMSYGNTGAVLAGYKCGYLTLEALRASARRLLTAALHSGSLDRMLHPVIIVHEIAGTTRIKAAELAERSPGVGFEECKDEDGGINPNYMQDGRTVSYRLNVTKAGKYHMSFRVASENSNCAFRIFLDGEQIATAELKKPTGGWQVWTTITLKKAVELPEGEHELKFQFYTALNINWFEFSD